MWLDSMDFADPTVHTELAFVLANEAVLFKGLTSDENQSLIKVVRERSEPSPVVLRRYFQKFGDAHLPAAVSAGPPKNVSQVNSSITADSTPTPHDIAEATAIVELRGIILKHPKQSTRLLPSDWSRRFRQFLGTYRQFVEIRTPLLFASTYDESSGLISVQLGEEATNLLLRYQRLIDTYGKSVEMSSNSEGPDDQYVQLARISDPIERYRICGGKDVYDRAIEVVGEFVSRFRDSFDISKLRKSLNDAAIVPLPLEWFSDLVVMPGDSIYILRESFDRIQTLDEGNVIKKICAEIFASMQHGVPFVNSFDISSRIGVSHSELVSTLALSPILLYTPDKGYACEVFEKLVYGYVSPKSVAKYHKSVELLNMSPVRHLVLSIEKVLETVPECRLPAEYFLAWCSALDVEPRLVWRCLRDKIFWSGTQSEFQVVLRRSKARKEGMGAKNHADSIPSDVLQTIKQEVKKLGDSCTIDKLTSNLHWGKQSELAKKYGSLKDVLHNLGDIFYDPNYVYLRSSIDKLVSWPDAQSESQHTHETSLQELETKFTTLASVSSLIVYHLMNTGVGFYPLSEAFDLLTNAGYDRDLIYSLDYIFVPDTIIYLRKSALNDETPTDTSPESAVIRALRNSPRYAVEYDNLIRALLGSGLYNVDQIDTIRRSLVDDCDKLDARFEGLGRSCFYNPNVVLLKSAAKEELATELGEYSALSPAKIKRKMGGATHAQLDTDEIDMNDTHLQRAVDSRVLPRWCVIGAVVSVESKPEGNFVIVSVNGGDSAQVRSLSRTDETSLITISDMIPKSIRAGDTVKVLDGPFKDSIFHVVGSTGTEVSVQITKFEFKSLPTESVVAVVAAI